MLHARDLAGRRQQLVDQGVPKSTVLSEMWFILSAVQGPDYARQVRDTTEQEMTPAQIAEAQKLAREWKPKPER